MQPVFVYGTLKRGHANHGLLKDATFLKEGEVNGSIYDLNGGIPGLVRANEETKERVHGEVFMVNDEQLARLDRLEGHPGLYKREQVPVYSPGRVEMAETYVWPHGVHPQNRIQSGRF